MAYIPNFAFPVISAFLPCFTAPTAERFIALMLSAIITVGNHTVSNLVRTLDVFLPGHPTTYHHVFSHRCWSGWQLCYVLARLLIEMFCPDGLIHLVGDDHVLPHPGRHVFGKDRHRDAVRSSHSYTAFHYGHKWVVLSVLVKMPFSNRLWALPVLVALYHSRDWNKKHWRRHKTPPQIMEGLIAAMLRLFPTRRFSFAGDGNFATHQLARFAATHQKRLVMISRFYPKAALYEAAPRLRKVQKGRPRIKGTKLPCPKTVVARTKKYEHLTVAWYGGETRRIEVVKGTGQWYRIGHGIVEIKWVYVKDNEGTHRDEYFFTTDTTMTAQTIVETYTGRWNIETTFQELNAHLKIGSTRCRIEMSILRQIPCLFGLYSIVVLLYANLYPSGDKTFAIIWPGKKNVTFSDALTAVRKAIWREWFFKRADQSNTFEKIPKEIQETLLRSLSLVA